MRRLRETQGVARGRTGRRHYETALIGVRRHIRARECLCCERAYGLIVDETKVRQRARQKKNMRQLPKKHFSVDNEKKGKTKISHHFWFICRRRAFAVCLAIQCFFTKSFPIEEIFGVGSILRSKQAGDVGRPRSKCGDHAAGVRQIRPRRKHRRLHGARARALS